MQQIIVPIDFSPHSENALRNALNIARRLDMGLLLMHAIPLPVGFTQTQLIYGEYQHIQTQKDSAHQRLKKMIQNAAKGKKGLSYQTIVTVGHLSHGLKFIEKHNEVALVVMSSSGSNGFIESLVGSNSYDIMKDVDCPVIALPENANISTMKSIALAGDYAEPIEPHLLKQLIHIAGAFFAKIEVVHVQDGKTLEDDQIDIARGLARYLRKVPHTFHFKNYDDVKDGLMAFCQNHRVDMLTLVPRQQSILEKIVHKSNTKELVKDMPMPLMLLQD